MDRKPYNFILPRLAVGSFESRLDPVFHAIVTLISSNELSYINQTFPITTPAEHVLHIDIRDGEMGLTKHLDKGYEFINKHIEDGNVLVHCHAGISRSPSMAAYYISKKCNMHPIDAIKMIRACRPIVDPYSGFMYELTKNYMEQEGHKLPAVTKKMVIVE